MIKTIADQYLAQNAGRRYPFRDDTELPDWLPDSGVLDFRCTLYGVGAGTAPEARLVNVAHTGDGNVRFTVDLSAGGVVVDTIRFLVPSGMSKEPYTAYASGDRSTGALTVTRAAIPPSTEALPYDAEVEYLESTKNTGQFINTGFVPTSSTTWELDFSFDDTTTGKLMGSGNAGNARFNIGIESGKFRCAYGARWFDVVATPDTDRHVWRLAALDARHAEAQIDNGTPAAIALTADFAPSGSIMIYRRYGSENMKYAGRLFGSKIWEGDALVRDMIPVRFTNERGVSEGAMYDRVSGQLFRNANTAANAAPFNYGNDVAHAPGASEYPVDIPLAATTVVCDSLKVMSVQSAHVAPDALDESDPAGRNTVTRLTGEIVLAEGRNAEPYLDGHHLRLDIRKGAGLGENCQSTVSGQTCDNVLFTVNGERPGSDGNIRIVGEDGITVTPEPDEHALTVRLDTTAHDTLASECASTCNGG